MRQRTLLPAAHIKKPGIVAGQNSLKGDGRSVRDLTLALRLNTLHLLRAPPRNTVSVSEPLSILDACRVRPLALLLLHDLRVRGQNGAEYEHEGAEKCRGDFPHCDYLPNEAAGIRCIQSRSSYMIPRIRVPVNISSNEAPERSCILPSYYAFV